VHCFQIKISDKFYVYTEKNICYSLNNSDTVQIDVVAVFKIDK